MRTLLISAAMLASTLAHAAGFEAGSNTLDELAEALREACPAPGIGPQAWWARTRDILARIDSEKSCQRICSDGKPCGLTPPCPDCGRAVHDFPEAS